MTAPSQSPRAEILGSFAYFARADLAALIRQARAAGVQVDFLADSGAFTAHTTGKMITVKQYATWLRIWAAHINAAMTLDVIGDPAATAHNTELLLDEVEETVPIVPIFHIGSPWADLEHWCAAHPYVALGGGVAVNVRGKALMAWLVKAHKIAASCGAVLHGLGMTRPPYADLLPWYSTDSSHWSVGARTGTVTLFDRRRGHWVCVRYQDIRRSLDPVRRAATPAYAPLIRSYGGDPQALATVGFGLARHRGREQMRADRRWLLQASAASWQAYAAHLRARHRSVLAPPGVTGTGPKVYLAAGSEAEFHLIAESAVMVQEGDRV